jgi:hypothetical protein
VLNRLNRRSQHFRRNIFRVYVGWSFGDDGFGKLAELAEVNGVLDQQADGVSLC